jgi:hypothetical protein
MIDSVKIGAMTYKVELVQDLHLGEGDERKDLHGQIWQDKLQIDVEADQNEQMQIATVLHEALHGILNHAGQDHEERLIIALGFGLVQFIRDNPKLIDLIQHGERQNLMPNILTRGPLHIVEYTDKMHPIQSNGNEE